jgi:hypothetical protein
VQDNAIFLLLNNLLRSMRILIFLTFLTLGCVKSKEYSDVPYLEFRGFSKLTMDQRKILPTDSVLMTLFFTDGDGDFGSLSMGQDANIFLIDLRTNEIMQQYVAPLVPEEGIANGISGTIKIFVYNTCCYYPPSSGISACDSSPSYPTNDLPIEIYIMDRAGNKSNTVKADLITLNCN